MDIETFQKRSNPEVVRGKTCPVCGSAAVLFIAYGLVDEADFDQEVLLGGCCVEKESPNLACRSCEHSWIAEE